MSMQKPLHLKWLEKSSGQMPHLVKSSFNKISSKNYSESMLLNHLDTVVIGRFDSLTPQITSAYSRIVRSVENFAIDVAASMLNLHHFCLSAYVASTLF